MPALPSQSRLPANVCYNSQNNREHSIAFSILYKPGLWTATFPLLAFSTAPCPLIPLPASIPTAIQDLPVQTTMDDSHSRASELTLPPMAGSDLSVHQNNPRRSRQYSTEAWDAIKPLIKKFYIDDNKSLPQLMAMLSEKHDFHPTVKMFKRKFELWNFAKNITDKTARPLLDQKTVSDATGRLTILGPHGRPVDERRLRKYLRRKGRTPLNPMLSMQHLSTSGDSTSTTTTSHRKLLDVSDKYQDPHDMLPDGGSYEQDCPYRPWAKKFRFSETYPDGTIYQGDSFGYDSYINFDEERPCTSHCFCRKHHLQEAFTFEAHKSVNQMHITIYSHSLYDELATHIPLDNVERALGCPTRTVNGLALLRHYHTLKRRFKDLYSALCDNPANHSLALEMNLLVNGFLGDGQVFQSFGYENLYELGFMDYQLWKYFQKQKLDKDITELDDGFCAIDDEEALPTSEFQSRSPITFVEEALADQSTKDLTEPLLDIDNEIQGTCSRPADTENPEVCISTALHITDGPDVHEYSYPSTVSDSGQLSGAPHQIDKNALAFFLPEASKQTLLPESIHSIWREVFAGDEETLRQFIDRGADVNGTYGWRGSPLSQAVKMSGEAYR
ncbi:hypothetical protein DL98DRAFT_136415 [Cadophora sp. DSE1049]|nr:hypothetical protein DL98DRAFT_136415 [Cadophora sp. DSE1049]